MSDVDKNLFGEDLPRVGAPLFCEHWSNRKAFWIGVHAGRGLSAPSICKELADGSTPNLINAMLSEWGHTQRQGKHTHRPVKVMLSAKHRTMWHAEAKKRDCDMTELMRRVLVVVAQDDMYAALLEL